MRDNLFPEITSNFWGLYVSIYFQDGEPKSFDSDMWPSQSTNYKHLDTKKPYCSVKAWVSFDNRKQVRSGIYKVDGTVTLVSGGSHYGPVALGGKPDANFSQGTLLSYKYTGAYNYDDGTPFNEFGNGKNDRGRIEYVGCETFSPTDELSVGLLRQQAGSLVEIVYP